ncbi:MAG: zinc ribbon domain-containing protein [Candidatus Helarchaeota archaeon]
MVKLELQYWRRPGWRWRRWYWWRGGFSCIIVILILVSWIWYYTEPDPQIRLTILIVFLVIIGILLIAGVLIFYFVSKHRREHFREIQPQIQAERARRREALRRTRPTKYCIQCGKPIAKDANYCEFCGADQST